MLFALRLVLGMGESVAYPSYSKILAGNFQEQQRGLANAAIDAGCKVGPALGILVGGLLMGTLRMAHFLLHHRRLSLLWLVPWFIWAPKDQALIREQVGKVPSLAEICSKRSAWGTFLGLFCGNYVWYFIVTWLPSYFRDELHYSQNQMAIFGSIPLVGRARVHSDVRIALRPLDLERRQPEPGAKDVYGPWVVALDRDAGGRHRARPGDFAGAAVRRLLRLRALLIEHLGGDPDAGGSLGGGPLDRPAELRGQSVGNPGAMADGLDRAATGQFYWAFVVTTMFLVLGTICFTVVIRRVEPQMWRDYARTIQY